MRICESCGAAIDKSKSHYSDRRFCSRSCYFANFTPSFISHSAPFSDKFWSRTKISGSGCIEWIGSFFPNGYGRFFAPFLNTSTGTYRTTTAHRIAFWLAYGRLPHDLVRHTCDNKKCVNPKHLLDGSHRDNARDASERGLLPIGVDRTNSKLTKEGVMLIRSNSGMTIDELAKLLHVFPSTISKARSGKTWRHISPESTRTL